MRITIRIHEEDGGFWAEVPELPGCFSQADSLQGMVANIREAIELYIEEHPPCSERS